MTMLSIALIPMTANVDVKRFAKVLSKASAGKSTLLTSTNICKSNTHVAQAANNSPLEKMLLSALEQEEANASQVFFVVDNENTNWTKRCISRTKKVLLIGEVQDLDVFTTIAKELYWNNSSVEMDLVVEYPNDNRLELKKEKWLTPQNIQNQYHITSFNQTDIEQLHMLLNKSGKATERELTLQQVKEAA